MPSFAQIKRSIEVGTRVTLTHFNDYGPGDTMPWGQDGAITLPHTRRIAVKQSNAVAFKDDRPGANGQSWVYWPKAADINVHDERTFTVHSASRMTYVIEP